MTRFSNGAEMQKKQLDHWRRMVCQVADEIAVHTNDAGAIDLACWAGSLPAVKVTKKPSRPLAPTIDRDRFNP